MEFEEKQSFGNNPRNGCNFVGYTRRQDGVRNLTLTGHVVDYKWRRHQVTYLTSLFKWAEKETTKKDRKYYYGEQHRQELVESHNHTRPERIWYVKE